MWFSFILQCVRTFTQDMECRGNMYWELSHSYQPTRQYTFEVLAGKKPPPSPRYPCLTPSNCHHSYTPATVIHLHKTQRFQRSIAGLSVFYTQFELWFASHSFWRRHTTSHKQKKLLCGDWVYACTLLCSFTDTQQSRRPPPCGKQPCAKFQAFVYEDSVECGKWKHKVRHLSRDTIASKAGLPLFCFFVFLFTIYWW